MTTHHPSRRTVAALALVIAAAGLTACGSSGGSNGEASSAGPEGVDDGTTLTLWTRAPMEKQAKALVEAYNAGHDNQVELTVVPNDDYVAKVGAAAGGGGLPDLFAADIVYVPNWTDQGLFQDVSTRLDQLPFEAEVNEGHLEAGRIDGREHVVPFVLDLSVMFYNKDLYAEAGLDPEKGPASLVEFTEQAKAVAALGGGVKGSYFGGNCGGCGVFTWFPMVWAADQDVMDADGTRSLLDSEAARDVYATWRELVEADAVYPGAKDETGATWTGPFQEGDVGVMPYPATLLSTADETVNVGVSPIPGPDGGSSTFIGGDGIGISKDSPNADQAWNFLSWLLSEEAQVDVLAAGGDIVSRSDLVENEYSSADPRLVMINEVATQGRTPVAVNFQQAFNAPSSPWISLFRNAIYGEEDTVEEDNEEITKVLGQ